MKLYDFQKEILNMTEEKNKVAYYLDMGLGKTFVGSEKAMTLPEKTILVICQKSKIEDWKKHFEENYYPRVTIFDLTKSHDFKDFILETGNNFHFFGLRPIALINYELVFRRLELLRLRNYTLILDESSLIQNESAKRTRFISKLNFKNLILLSGTPCGGKYEKLFSQLKMLGLRMSKNDYWERFINWYNADFGTGFPVKMVSGYKNVDELKKLMNDLNCHFLKTDEVFELPTQIFIVEGIESSSDYKKFRKNKIVSVEGKDIVGDCNLSCLIGERQLCGSYSKEKMSALKDMLESTDDRLLIFYNFNDELKKIEDLCIQLNKPVSIINGDNKDLFCYEEHNNSVTLIQYQAGAMGLNLQKANKIIYFTPCLSSELFEQSKKRTHRIGQEKPCFYYKLIVHGSVEEKIYKALDQRKDFTEKLFEKEEI